MGTYVTFVNRNIWYQEKAKSYGVSFFFWSHKRPAYKYNKILQHNIIYNITI